MKNIHILSTDKPSKLGYHSDIVKEGKLDYAPLFGFDYFDKNKNYQHNPQHLYITSDENIKDIRHHKGKWQLEKGQILNKFPNYLTDLSECKLVIVTTDPELIEDGVQEIDDEFLEWFVKNPNCEYVEVKRDI